MNKMSSLIQKKLFQLQDVNYKEFHSKLMPTVNKNDVIGVKIPVLRKLAKEIYKTFSFNDIKSFFNDLPHQYYEENNLHGFLIEQIKDYELCISYLDNFLPYINNWATCDSLCPKCFKNNDNSYEKLLEKIRGWITSDKTYTIRYGIGMLMRSFLDERFSISYLDMVISIKSSEYYVNMMRAWFFATALAKQYESTICYIAGYKLDSWTHNKAIQKSVESNRISLEHKNELRKYRIKSEGLSC